MVVADVKFTLLFKFVYLCMILVSILYSRDFIVCEIEVFVVDKDLEDS